MASSGRIVGHLPRRLDTHRLYGKDSSLSMSAPDSSSKPQTNRSTVCWER